MGKNQKMRRASIKHAVLILLGLFLAGFLFLRYFGPAGTPAVVLAFRNSSGNQTAPLKLELAVSDAARAKGLMYRKSLSPYDGMFFAFPERKVQKFWMKDTFLSLDLLFLDNDLRVVGILRSLPILNNEVRSVEKPSRYVVELAAGSAERLGITEGSQALIHSGFSPAN